MPVYANELVLRVEEAFGSFSPDELAYLALTSKIERPFFDRLAFAFHRAAVDQHRLVAREWPITGVPRAKADLAIIQQGTPTLLLEGSAMYTFDCTRGEKGRAEYAGKMQSDLNRLSGASLTGAEIYCLLLATHPHQEIPQYLGETLKYSDGVNRAIRAFGSATKVAKEASTRLLATLRPHVLRASGKADAGVAFGIRTDVFWWLFGPFQAPDDLGIQL